MAIANLEQRLERLNTVITRLLAGQHDAIELSGELPDDALGHLEEAVQFLVMDLKTTKLANRDKEAALLLQQRTLDERLMTIEQQAAAIRQLSTPMLEIWRDVLVLPIIGNLDAARSNEMLTALLDSIVRMSIRWVIIDITGVECVDTNTADNLVTVVRAARLLGASCLLCGIQPAVAQILVDIGADLGGITTKRNLADALRHCLRHLYPV